MSYHEIEDCVESVAHIIHQSSLPEALKTSRLQEIFSFQALFDTSNTLGRIQQILHIYGLHEDTIYLKKIQVLHPMASLKRKEKHLAFHQFFEDRTQVFPEFAHMKNITFDASQRNIILENTFL